MTAAKNDAWSRLEGAAEAALRRSGEWRTRALEAEAEVGRLKEALERIASADELTSGTDPDALRADNAALRARLGEARRLLATIRRRVETIAAADE